MQGIGLSSNIRIYASKVILFLLLPRVRFTHGTPGQAVQTPKPTTLIGLSEISEISGAICHGALLA